MFVSDSVAACSWIFDIFQMHPQFYILRVKSTSNFLMGRVRTDPDTQMCKRSPVCLPVKILYTLLALLRYIQVEFIQYSVMNMSIGTKVPN